MDDASSDDDKRIVEAYIHLATCKDDLMKEAGYLERVVIPDDEEAIGACVKRR